jgi:hypothetical protein
MELFVLVIELIHRGLPDGVLTNIVVDISSSREISGNNGAVAVLLRRSLPNTEDPSLTVVHASLISVVILRCSHTSLTRGHRKYVWHILSQYQLPQRALRIVLHVSIR